MNATYLPPEFYNWLTRKSSLIKYIAIDTFPQNISEEKKNLRKIQIKKWREETLSNIDNFQKCIIHDGALDDRPHIRKPTFFSPKSIFLQYHKIKFIQQKIRHDLHKQYVNAVLLCQDLIDILSENSILPLDVDLYVNELEIFRSVLAQPLKTKALLRQELYLQGIINFRNRETKELSAIKATTQFFIDSAKPYVSDSTKFFPLMAIQDEFDVLLMNKFSPVKQDIEELIYGLESVEKTEFSALIIDLFYKFYRVLGITDRDHLSILAVFFFRSVFRFAEYVNPEYFQTSSDFHISTIAHKIECSAISPPHEYILFNDHDKVCEVFGKDKDFSAACQYFINATFYLNPLDVLNEINKGLITLVAVTNKRNVAVNNGAEKILPFETAFALLLGVIIASGAPAFEEIAEFAVKFAPQSLLCPEFDYALASTSATLRYCGVICESYKSNN